MSDRIEPMLKGKASLPLIVLIILSCGVEALISSRYHVMTAFYVMAWSSLLLLFFKTLAGYLDQLLASKHLRIEPLTPAMMLAFFPASYAALALVDGGATLTTISSTAMLLPPVLTLVFPWICSLSISHRIFGKQLGGVCLPQSIRTTWWRELKWGIPLWLAWIVLHHAEGTLLVVREGSEVLHAALYVGTALITIVLSQLFTAAQYPMMTSAGDAQVPRALKWLIGLFGLVLIYADQTLLMGLYDSVHQWLWWIGFAAICIALQNHSFQKLNQKMILTLAALILSVSGWATVQLEHKPRLKSYVNRTAFGSKWLDLHREYVSPFLGGYEQQIRDPKADHPDLHFDQKLDTPPPEKLRRPNILLISIDALRGDYVKPNQKSSPTPFISKLAQDGAFFTRAYAAGTRTAIGMTGVHFGRYSRETEWETWLYKRGKIYPPNSPTARKIKKRKQKHVYTTIPKDPPGGRIAERLQSVDYLTIAAPYAGYNDFFRPGVGFDKGFDHFKDLSEVKWPKKSGTKVTKAALSELDKALKVRKEGAPIFMWVHYYDPHESRRSLSTYRALCKHMDQGVEQLIEGFKERNLLDQTAIIITADHGEAFKEHGYTSHGSTVYEAQSRVPLVIYLPKPYRKAIKIDTPVSHVDIASTIAVLAQANTQYLSGLNLLPSVLGESTTERPIFSELHRYRSSNKKLSADLTALWRGDWKLIINHLKGITSLYNIKQNQAETKDYAEEETEIFDEMYDLAMTYRRRGYPLE